MPYSEKLEAMEINLQVESAAAVHSLQFQMRYSKGSGCFEKIMQQRTDGMLGSDESHNPGLAHTQSAKKVTTETRNIPPVHPYEITEDKRSEYY